MFLQVLGRTRRLAAALAAVSPFAAQAADTAGCRTIEDDRERLACYDAAFGRAPPARPEELARPEVASAPPRTTDSWLARQWDLDPAWRGATLRPRAHQANYVLPLHLTTRPNTSPSSPARGRTVDTPLDLDRSEVKFQLSFKVKAAEDLFGDNGDLWFAYTQQSNWQSYNRDNSSAFRETSYEPEAILTWRTDAEVLGWRWRFLNLGLVHQSNGRARPESRSWNRIYAAFGLERDNFALIVRPWHRIAFGGTDDNPDIEDYLGLGEIRLAHTRDGHVLSALARAGREGRGYLQLEWVFPVHRQLNGYLQITHGYGATLIDYNHRQTTVGLGLLLLPW